MEARLAQIEYGRLHADSLGSLQRKLVARRAAAQLDLLRVRRSRLEVRAPTRGVVLTDRLRLLIGRVVQEGESVLELGSLDGWQVQVLVSESDVRRVKVGQRAEVDLEAMSREEPTPIAGTVASVSAEPWAPVSTTEQATRAGRPVYRVAVDLAPPPAQAGTTSLRRGFTARARIQVGRGRILRVAFERLFRRGFRG